MPINKELNFDDLYKFWEYSLKNSNARIKASRENNVLDWSGGLTWEQAKIIALNGWRVGMKEIEKYRAKITPAITDKVLRANQVYAVTGSSVDVGRFLSNDPECFVSRELKEMNYPGKVFKIVVSISFSKEITPETIIQRGAIICALIDAIEFAGHRTEVVCNWAVSVRRNDSDRKGENKEHGWLEISVNIKKSSQPLDMTDLAFCLVHPAMLRRIMFSVAEIEGWSDSVEGYGYPAEATDKGDMYIKEIFSGNTHDNEVIMWVTEELIKLGINIVMD